MTVWIYVDTSKQVGDKDHLKVFATEVAAEIGSRGTTRKGLRSSMRFWNNHALPSGVLETRIVVDGVRKSKWLRPTLMLISICPPHFASGHR